MTVFLRHSAFKQGSVGQIHPIAYSYMAHTLLMVFTSLNGWGVVNKDEYFMTRKSHDSRFTTGEVLPEHSRGSLVYVLPRPLPHNSRGQQWCRDRPAHGV